jgi:protein TonB
VKRVEHPRLGWVSLLSILVSCVATQPIESPHTPKPCPTAYYPSEMRARGIEGVVIMALTVLPDGSVSDIVVVKSAGPEFDRAATEGMSCMRFRPAMRDGVAVPSRIRWTYRFENDRDDQRVDR